MQIGYTTWTWIQNEHDNFNPYRGYEKQFFAQSLKEISSLGYEVMENFNIIVDLYEGSSEFSELLHQYGVKFVNVYHYLKTDFEAEKSMAERCCAFLRKHDAYFLNIQTPSYAAPRGTSESRATEEELESSTNKLKETLKICEDYGVTLCLHPHYGKTVFLESEIDYVLERISSTSFGLTLDTAHLHIAGMNVPDALNKYRDHLKYLHVKDFKPSKVRNNNQLTGFCELGRGEVDFPNVFRALGQIGYDGYVTVECDYPQICNYESALTSINYLKQNLG